jgi:hypothetical protein
MMQVVALLQLGDPSTTTSTDLEEMVLTLAEMRVDADAAVEALSLLGVPALPAG